MESIMHAWNMIDILALTFIKGLTANTLIDIVDTTDGLEGVLSKVRLDLFTTTLRDLRDMACAQLELCRKCDVQAISWWHDVYPDRLRAILHPPAILFVRGNLPAEEHPSIAVVGTRSCSIHYGKPVTSSLVKTWTERGAVIVSGLAIGVDTIAHEACLKANGRTIAVIASGHDCISPREARHLAQTIVNSGGAVVTEYKCGVKAMPPYFPARNRIISGLADSVVVTESKTTGGALITADFAFKDGRTVFAVPGSIYSSRSAGTNQLIRDGKARVLCDADDVLRAPSKGLFVREASFAFSSELDRSILQNLENEPASAEALAVACKCTVATILGRMLELELMGYISVVPGQRYTLRG